MRRNKNILILSGVLAISLLSACSKNFLDLKPYVSVPTDEAIQTVDDLDNAMNGTYSGLRATDLYGRTLPVNGDLLGDNIYVSTKNSGRYIPQSNYTLTPNDATTEGFWDDAYATILQANNIIDAVTKDTALANNPAAAEYKAEALSVRALLYFELVRYFATPYAVDPSKPGVPLSLHFDITAKPARSTVAEVYTQILADLSDADKLYGAYRGSAYFSKYASLALAAKVSLYQKNYTQALSFAKNVIDNSGFTLVTRANYLGYWASTAPHDGGTTVETLFEVSTDEVNNNGFDELANMYVQSGGYGDLLASDDLYNTYSATDIRKSLILVGTRGTNTAAKIVNKYQAVSGDRDDKKVLRLSDVYLIAAEAAHLSATPDDVAAVGYLNTLVAERDPSLVYTAGPTLTTDIITERRKELAFEGDRFNDLNRLSLPINTQTTGAVIAVGDPRRLLPIPQQSIDANNNIVPNP